MQRKLSWNLYIGAFIITAAIFGIGFYIGGLTQQQIYAEMGKEVIHMQDKMQNMELLVLSEDTNYFCDIYQGKLPVLDQDTFDIGQKLEYLESEKGVTDIEMKMEYFELELRDYILMQKAKEKCGLEMPILIYFYSNQNCSNCLKQGYEITNLRTELYNENEMLRVYTYDGSMNDSIVVKTLRKEFNITTYPTMVLMKNNVSIIEGLHTKDQMKQELTILN